ncbi:hypothetical protein [Halalkalibacter akibai]|nr:hypothetical protein [Halalkalibacter akibai]
MLSLFKKNKKHQQSCCKVVIEEVKKENIPQTTTDMKQDLK